MFPSSAPFRWSDDGESRDDHSITLSLLTSVASGVMMGLLGLRGNSSLVVSDSTRRNHPDRSPSEPFTYTTPVVSLLVSSFRGRAVQQASHDSKEFGAFCFASENTGNAKSYEAF